MDIKKLLSIEYKTLSSTIGLSIDEKSFFIKRHQLINLNIKIITCEEHILCFLQFVLDCYK